MKNNKNFNLIVIAVLFVCMFPITAYANSSWHWISSTRPLDLLPIVIIATLLIEILSINYIAKVKNLKIVTPVVLVANLASFLIPYILIGADPYNVYSGDGLFYTINRTVDASPTFTVSLSYLMITLFVETPIVFLFLMKKVKNRKLLLVVIVVANILTTLLTFAVERIFCHGEW